MKYRKRNRRDFGGFGRHFENGFAHLLADAICLTLALVSMMLSYILIAVGGALGSVARYALSGSIADQFGDGFPWGTLIVNVTGSFAIGFFATVSGPDGKFLASSETRQFFMTGVCGGYTTFSSFSLQTLNLARDGEWFRAGAYTLSSVVACLIGVWVGHIAAAYLNQLKSA